MNLALWIVPGRLAAAGLILPAALGIAPLGAVGAVGVAMLMVGATITHLRLQEAQSVLVSLVVPTRTPADRELHREPAGPIGQGAIHEHSSHLG
jgi:hypothetical protein